MIGVDSKIGNLGKICVFWGVRNTIIGKKKASNVLSIQRNASVNGPGGIDTFSLKLRFGAELDGGVWCGRRGVEGGAGEDAAFIVE